MGEGGMATVYLADDLRHERKVALEVLVVLVQSFFEELRRLTSN